MGFSRQEDWSGVPLPFPFTYYTSSRRNHCLSCIISYEIHYLSAEPFIPTGNELWCELDITAWLCQTRIRATWSLLCRGWLSNVVAEALEMLQFALTNSLGTDSKSPRKADAGNSDKCNLDVNVGVGVSLCCHLND